MPLYAAQVLPKQPELVESLKKVMKSWLAMEPKLAFQPEFTDVMMLLDAEPAPAQPVIPEQQTVQLDPHVYRELVNELRDVALEYHSAQQLRERISRALSKAVTAAHPHLEQPVSEPYKLPVGYFSYGSECGFDWHNTEKEAIEAAEAVIDDYLGDACDGWSEETDSVCWGVILQQATKVDERPRTDDDKCDPAIDMVCEYALLPELVGNSPVIPEGWKLVPVNATRAMIDAAARVEEDGYDAMHKAMLAVAPAREQK
ncbi:hypothetical protein [Obesumbacterium proteus]|uniref:hypothetical protein n=1 Tax=Obesumbacterium proteus TaxID=82983 RepID=UPI00242F1386|nr:hypothetical protein [Obesumbacterium proteus]